MSIKVPAYEGDKPYIFVSYAHKDSDAVLPIIQELYDKKYRIWYDEGIAPGSEWPKNIADHLNGCDYVLIFVSEHSIASPNCENEVVRSVESGKEILQYSFNGLMHALLDEKKVRTISDRETLFSELPQKYIGDGSGYERKVSVRRSSPVYNILLAFAIILVIALITGLIGLDAGWFDSYLPGLSVNSEPETVEETVIEEEGPDISDQNLADYFAEGVGRADLSQKLAFVDKEEMDNFCGAVGYRGDDIITMRFLADSDIEEVWLDEASPHALQYLTNCPRLKRVYIKITAFPVEIPEEAKYEIMLMQ